MAGAFSDNQPDYSWLQPGEVKTWKHYWYPIRHLGAFKNANTEAAVNLEPRDRSLFLAFNTTTRHEGAQVELTAAGRPLHSRSIDIGPASLTRSTCHCQTGSIPSTLRAALSDKNGRELIAYAPNRAPESTHAEPVERPIPPAEVASVEELYLTGLRIEQLYSPAFEPDPYYEEALRREPNDYRANTALGILYCKRGRFAAAEEKLRAAIGQSRRNYIRPKDTEADYYLGVSLRAQDRLSEAEDAFQAAAWNPAWRAASCYALAELACRRRDWADALEQVERSLALNARDARTLALKSSILHQTDQVDEAVAAAEAALALDPLEFRALNELGPVRAAHSRMRDDVQSYLDLAVEYGNGGFYLEALELLEDAAHLSADDDQGDPMVYYYFAFYAEALGDAEAASRARQLAPTMPSDYCFPHRWEAEPPCARPSNANPPTPAPPITSATSFMITSPSRPSPPGKWRGAAIRVLLPLIGTWVWPMPKCGVTCPTRSQVWNRRLPFSRPTLGSCTNWTCCAKPRGSKPTTRLARLEQRVDIVRTRDDALTRMIILLIAQGEQDRALDWLRGRQFHNWEGGGEIREVFVDALLTRGLRALRKNQPEDALRDFRAALEFPRNLAVGQPKRDSRRAQIQFLIGQAEEALASRMPPVSHSHWPQRSRRRSGDAGYYRARALLKLGASTEGTPLLENLLSEGRRLLEAPPAADYFAKFGEKESARARGARGYYWMALGEIGLGRHEAAIQSLERALSSNPAHFWARTQLESLQPPPNSEAQNQ